MIGAVKACAALTAFAWFPSQPTVAYVQVARTPAESRVPKIVWFGMAGLAAMTIVHAMTASYLVQIGAHRGFQVTSVNAVLTGMALVALLPGPVAAALETRWPAQRVLLGGAVLQLALSTVVMTVTAFTPYASAAVLFPSVIVFTHTFAFGLLATLDSSGRSLAATPAMTMAGAALGALVGGTLVKVCGLGGIPWAAACSRHSPCSASRADRPRARFIPTRRSSNENPTSLCRPVDLPRKRCALGSAALGAQDHV
jgi:predicted MFS family arabinose efflux permease